MLLQARAAASAQQSPEVTVKNLSVLIESLEGKDNYRPYCAVCHGRDGKGAGPAAPALKGPFPDLTRLVDPSGKFNSSVVQDSIAGQNRRPGAHGTLDMPVWGLVFTSVQSRAETTLHIHKLAKYLESMQRH